MRRSLTQYLTEFHRTTQYGMDYVLGRNCRFLQGPQTNPFSVRRIRDKIEAGKEHCETFLNYRRDGSPFMNLLMIAPLMDSRGTVRYFIGAQVDVSGLVKDCSGLESLATLMERESSTDSGDDADTIRSKTNNDDNNIANKPLPQEPQPDDELEEFRELVKMFNISELKTVRESGGSLHRTQQEDIHATEKGANWHKPRLTIRDDASTNRRLSDPLSIRIPMGGQLRGVYEHYLLVRPYPNLRVLFASPSLRVPGMLQSPFMNRIGGSPKVREMLTQAFAEGHGITAKVRWISKGDTEGRGRWIHCTPLLGSNGHVGVWMVVLVDDETDSLRMINRRKAAPPVERHMGNYHPASVEDEDDMSLSNFAAAHQARDSR
jgi:hypothetical protein